MSTSVRNAQLLTTLAEAEGYDDIVALCEACIADSVNPGICVTDGCGYTCEVEPDQDRGWCEICNKGTVKAALVLAGLI